MKINSPEFKALSGKEQEKLLDEAQEYYDKVMSGEIHPCSYEGKEPTLILRRGKV